MLETPSNVADVATPIHVTRQRYLVAPEGSNPQKFFLRMITIKILNKKGLKIKNPLRP
jgi:hypothetical protein